MASFDSRIHHGSHPDAPYPPPAPPGKVIRSSLTTAPHYAPRFGEASEHPQPIEAKSSKFVSIQTSPSNPHLFAAINLHTLTDEELRGSATKKVAPLLCQINRISMSSSLEDRLKGRLWKTEEELVLSRGNPHLGPSIASTCLSWSPTAMQVATGLTTGNLCIHSFPQLEGHCSQEQYSVGRTKRPATAVAWRPNFNHVALGLQMGGGPAQHHQRKPKATDFGCLLWDVNSSTTAAPLLKVCHNAGVASLEWLHGGQTLAVGCQLRQLQIYDLRATSSSSPMTLRGAHQEAVQGVCVDPGNPYIVATYGNTDPVKLWDLRRLETPLAEIKVTDAPSAIAWSRSGVLSVAVDNRVLHYEAHARPHLIGQTYAQRNILDMAIVPEEQRFLVVMDDKSVHDVSKHTLSPMTLSNGDGCIVHAFGSHMWKAKSSISDISSVMKERAKCDQASRYSLDAKTNMNIMSSISKENKALAELWSWVVRLEDDTSVNLTHGGVWHLLEMDTSSDVQDDVVPATCLDMELYDSKARRAALAACGWKATDEHDLILEEYEERGEYERAAAMAVWHDNVGMAVEVLARGATESKNSSLLQLVSIGIAGYNGTNSSVWQQACSTLLDREELVGDSTDFSFAYLHALLRFLLADDQESGLKSVLEDNKLSLCDRVGFACRFLRRSELRVQLLSWIAICQDEGNVEGLVLTGLTLDGIKILQSFVDKTGDVQTATLVTSRVIMPSSWTAERKICSEWLDSYRGLLNSWQMWQSRAMFDVDRAELLRSISNSSEQEPGKIVKLNAKPGEPDIFDSPTFPAQLDARCNFCSVSLSGARKQEGISSQWLARSKNVLSCCPRCRKPLPRCAICLLSLGCLNPYRYMEQKKVKNSRNGSGNESLANLPFAEWFTWCMRCKHGGHAHHLVGWFSNHETCPVSGCDCKCQFDGTNKLTRQHSNGLVIQSSDHGE